MSSHLLRVAAAVALAAIVDGACASAGQKPPVVAPAGHVDPVPTGLEYALPKTTLVVDVQVERVSDVPGKYCDFLDLFFPELELAAACQAKNAKPGDPLLAGKMKTTVAGYAVALKGMPDASRKRSLDFDASWHVERTDSFALTETGTLSGADMARVDRTTEIVVGVLSNIAKIAGRFVFGAGTPPAAVPAPDKGRKPAPPRDAPWDLYADIHANYELLAADRREIYDGLWKTNSSDGRTRLAFATRSYLAIADGIKQLNIVLGGVGAQGAQTLIPELRKQVSDRLTDDFLGSKKKDSWTPEYEITPEAPTSSTTAVSVPLFEINGCGVISEKMQPVKNRLAALACKGPTTTVKALALSIKTASSHVAARGTHADPSPAESTDKDILYYLRPEGTLLNIAGTCGAAATLTAAKGGDPTLADHAETDCNMADQPSLLAQWGTMHGVPKAGRDYSYSLTMYEATGALKSIKLTSKAALDKGTIDSMFGIATTLLDAKDAATAAAKKKADEEAAKIDELTLLTRARQILDEKSKIKKLCAELGLTSCEY